MTTYCKLNKTNAGPVLEAIKRADALANKEQQAEKAREIYAKAQFPFKLQKAMSGDSEAQYLVGKAYSSGLGVTKDESAAFEWFSKSAANGNAQGENAVGNDYLFGSDGVSKDYPTALKWFRKAAAQGSAKAEDNLGGMYFNGWGVPQNYAVALAYYRKAAATGLDPAEASLGYMYASGTGVKQDYVEADMWYRRAANQGNDYAQSNLGINYEYGQGVEPDYATAAFWYRRAAKQGNADASKFLSQCAGQAEIIADEPLRARNSVQDAEEAKQTTNETWVDPKTSLMWERVSPVEDGTWQGADDYCRNLSLDGYTGWRLPAISELTAIYDAESTNRWHIRGGKLQPHGKVWSSTQLRSTQRIADHYVIYAETFDFQGSTLDVASRMDTLGRLCTSSATPA
jgi:TPR repeat protein